MNNKSTIPSVAECEATLRGFEEQREALIAQHEQHAAKRREISFAAHGGDPEASKLLDGLHEESVRYESRLVSITDAINEARRRLEQSRAHEVREQDRERALLLRKALASFIEAGKGCDAALELLISASTDLRNSITIMNKLGCSHPSHAQPDSLGSLALRTALTETAWVRYFERVGPMEKKTFSGLLQSWAPMVERKIATLLGDEQTNETEAA